MTPVKKKLKKKPQLHDSLSSDLSRDRTISFGQTPSYRFLAQILLNFSPSPLLSPPISSPLSASLSPYYLFYSLLRSLLYSLLHSLLHSHLYPLSCFYFSHALSPTPEMRNSAKRRGGRRGNHHLRVATRRTATRELVLTQFLHRFLLSSPASRRKVSTHCSLLIHDLQSAMTYCQSTVSKI